MKAFRYLILIMFLLNMATFALMYAGSGLGSFISSFSFIALIVYYFFNDKQHLALPFIILGLIYFIISGLVYIDAVDEFFKEAIKYLIVTVMAVGLMSETTYKEILIIFSIGAISIILNSLIFPNLYGRYSGFYLNPNRAGLVCILGFALAFKVEKYMYQLALQFIFVLAGIMTLSRYFILILVAVYIISIIANKRNLIAFVVGGFALLLIFTQSSFQLNTDRLSALKSLFSDNVDTETITKESRNETWSMFTDKILDSPIVGNGFDSMKGNEKSVLNKVGVHNTYLMILGESGIIPFLIVIIIYVSLFFRSIKHFTENPIYTYIAFILLTNLLVTHNYFNNYITILISIWLYIKVKAEPNYQTTNPILK